MRASRNAAASVVDACVWLTSTKHARYVAHSCSVAPWVARNFADMETSSDTCVGVARTHSSARMDRCVW